MNQKICQLCGQPFTPTSGKQRYCNKETTKVCAKCGQSFTVRCHPDFSQECPECSRYKFCLNCNERFLPKTGRQIFCNLLKEKECSVCGNIFTYICGSAVPQVCSPECQVKLIIKKRAESASRLTRICKWCGKEFQPRDHRQLYCEDIHYKECAVCGTKFVIDPTVDPTVMTCSKECTSKLMSQNHDYVKSSETYKQKMLEKYGVSNARNIPGVEEKMKQTALERYGAAWYTQTDEYKRRAKQTNLEKYGSEWFAGSAEAKERRTATNLAKYGVANPAQLTDFRDKVMQTNLAKYGLEFPQQSKEFQEAVKQRNIARYGVEHPMMLKKFQQKAIQTNITKYGRTAYNQLHIQNIQAWYAFIDDPEGYIANHYSTKPRVEQLAADLGVDNSTIDVYLKKYDARASVRQAKSLMEESIYGLIKLLDTGIRIITNDKSAIAPKELDLYLPDYNFAIECNPTATHNSSVCDPWGGEPKHRLYHKWKTDACIEKGITLYHIFGYEWTHKRKIIESMIANKLGKNQNVVYARKCKIVEVPWAAADRFLQRNHRQGSVTSPIRLGLEYNGELVSLMTFGKMRSGIGTGKDSLEDCYELVRFCSLLNTSVVGGASKLFKHFISTYNPNRIRSFSDRAHTSGNLYPTLSFRKITESDPGYVWVNVATDKAYHRTNAQKKNIKQFLKDDSIDLSKTETEIMIEHGFVQVFDSGTITWEWSR